VIPSPKAPSFIAVEKETGKVVWTDDSPGDRIFHGQWSSPGYGIVNGKGQVYFPGGDGWLYAFEPKGDPDRPGKGKLIWKFDCNPAGAKYVLGGRGTANEIISTPVFRDNRVFIAVGQDPEHGEGIGHLYCLDATKRGDVSPELGDWDPRTRIKVPLKDPATGQRKKTYDKNPNSAMVWHYGYDPETKKNDFGRTISTCAIQGDLLFAVELAGFLHCLDVNTGKPHWKYDLLAAAWGSPYVVDDKVYIGDEDGDVAIFDCSAQENKLAELNMGNNVPTTAVAVDGVLYLATKSHVYAIEQQ
jgi:outer membrane protein assembly factor BamB